MCNETQWITREDSFISEINFSSENPAPQKFSIIHMLVFFSTS